MSSQVTLCAGYGQMTTIDGTNYSQIGTFGNNINYARVCASKNGTMFFATSTSNDRIMYINGSANAIVDSINHYSFALSNTYYADTLFGLSNGALIRYKISSKSVVDSVSLSSPAYMAERPNSREVWVSGAGKIYVVGNHAALSVTSFATSGSSYDQGELRFTATGDTAYVSCPFSHKIYKYNAVTKTKIDSVALTDYLAGLEISSGGNTLFASFGGINTIRIYNTATMVKIDSITATRRPFGLYRHPARPEIWASNHNNGYITVYNQSTFAAIDSIPTYSQNGNVAFGSESVATSVMSLAAVQNGIRLWPNPAKDVIHIEEPGADARLKVYNAKGEEVSVKFYDAASLDISALAPGLYLLNISTQKGSSTTRFMKE